MSSRFGCDLETLVIKKSIVYDFLKLRAVDGSAAVVLGSNVKAKSRDGRCRGVCGSSQRNRLNSLPFFLWKGNESYISKRIV